MFVNTQWNTSRIRLSAQLILCQWLVSESSAVLFPLFVFYSELLSTFCYCSVFMLGLNILFTYNPPRLRAGTIEYILLFLLIMWGNNTFIQYAGQPTREVCGTYLVYNPTKTQPSPLILEIPFAVLLVFGGKQSIHIYLLI